MDKLKYLPNVITSLRIAGTAGLLFTVPFSKEFYILYSFCGLTDVLDGAVARATKSSSLLGAKLDSIADLIFYTVMMVLIMPYLWVTLPVRIWYAVGAILIIRLMAYVIAAVKYKCFASIHTYGNKATGLAVFALPYFIMAESVAVGYSIGVCIIAAMSSLEELFMHIEAKEYDPGRKSIFIRRSEKKNSK